jgi:Putative Actinobacterial Holin-X, holin superfamily III
VTAPTPPPQPPTGGMGVPVSRPAEVADASVGELIGNVTRDLSTLMRQELALAQAELRQEAVKTGKAAGTLSGAGVAGVFVLLFLSLALWAGLANVMDAGWAAVLVAVVWAVIGGVLYAMGRARLREVRPKPERTVDTLGSIPDALRGQRTP